ncbi:hypothetical protein CCACVL1_18759 [Corchorus capsularis]|uniref:Uncharacterized protein n=1 Tax=Corchorus capsularis TaxID=210143 RepID=A0A1R3HK41_COCAP|nr:hypothetical protein CCACVL1_18759 [Corchorus capsularis]
MEWKHRKKAKVLLAIPRKKAPTDPKHTHTNTKLKSPQNPDSPGTYRESYGGELEEKEPSFDQ